MSCRGNRSDECIYTRQLRRSNRKNILVLAAHPDDETLGCGGTIRKLSNLGNNIMLLTFTDGESSRDNTENISDRNNLLPRVCKILGIKKWASGKFPDNEMDKVSLLELTKFIESTTKQYNFVPDIIFTHHPGCLNIDHSLVYRATMTAFRPQRGGNIKIYSYSVPSSTDYNPLANFNGNVYFKLEQNCIDAKKSALRVYNSEMREYPHSRSFKNVENLMRVWGSEVGTELAEKFQLIREVL